MNFKKVKILSFILIGSMLAATNINAQSPLDGVDATNAFQKLFDPLMSFVIVAVSYLAAFIPALKNVNKAALTGVVIVLIGIISAAYFKASIQEILISALMAILGYNNIIKQMLPSPNDSTSENTETNQ